MNLRLDKKMSFLLLLTLLLALALYAGSYFLYLSPLKDSLALKQSQLKAEQQLNNSIEKQLSNVNTSEPVSSAEMQEMLPGDPLIEQLMLDIEKAEVISDSMVLSMEFNAANDATADGAMEETNQTAAEQETETHDTEVPTEEENKKPQLIMPEGLSKTTVTVVVESDTYFDLEKFIETLENLKRMVMVESISFSGPEELNSLGNDVEPIQLTIALNTFHLTGFDELNDYNPKIETPEPANKRNPFPSFGDVPDENLTEDRPAEEQDEQ